MLRENPLTTIAVLALFILLVCSASALAIPCSWAGTVKVNGNNVNGSFLIPWDNSTMIPVQNYSNPSFKISALPLGYYSLDVNENSTYIYFKIEHLVADQLPSKWLSGRAYDGSDLPTLDLTFTDSDNDSYSVGYVGYTGTDKDCNDTDNTTYPGAPEVCDNGIDDDCDGLINLDDPDCQPCIDNDGDGYGVSGLNCTYPGIDCDDDPGQCGAACHPGAAEACDGYDNDCDTLIDNVKGTNESITQPCGSSNVGECRYGTQTCVNGSWDSCVGNIEPVNEICRDGKDNNCDGNIDEYCGGGGGTPTGGGYTCTEDWSCTEWSACSPEGTQTRTCTYSNDCGSSIRKPAEEQDCTYIPSYQPCNNNGECGPGETPENCPNDCRPSRVCTAGVRVCAGDDLMQCSSDGTGWERVETCEYGCSGEACNLPSEGGNVTPAGPGPSPPGGGITGLIVSNPVPFAAIIIVIIAAAGYGVYRKKSR